MYMIYQTIDFFAQTDVIPIRFRNMYKHTCVFTGRRDET